MLRAFLSASALVALIAACAEHPREPQKLPHAIKAPADPPRVAEPTRAAQKDSHKKPAQVKRWSEGLSTPESVLYDADRDRYLVSNINGKPLDADGNGFITALSPNGTVTKQKLIEGGVDKVKLDAPKGLAISGGVLYVADISVVRKFDAATGAPKGDIVIPGATFLNDVAVGADGRVFVSDSGLKAGTKDFEPTGTDAVWAIDKNGKARALAKSKELAQPNGLLAAPNGLVVTSFAGKEIYRLDDKGARQDVTALPDGALDGIAALADGTLLVASWKASAIYKGKLGGPFELAVFDVKSPADIGYDTKRKRLLIPLFDDNQVEAYALE